MRRLGRQPSPKEPLIHCPAVQAISGQPLEPESYAIRDAWRISWFCQRFVIGEFLVKHRKTRRACALRARVRPKREVTRR